MKTKIFFRILIITMLVSLFLSLGMGKSQGKERRDVTIDAILTEVQKGLRTAQTQIVGSEMPPLGEVELTLQTMITTKVPGKVSFFIFTFGSTWEKERSQQLVLKLKPPKKYKKGEKALKPKFSEELVEAIVAAAKGVDSARHREPPLQLDTLAIEISFVVDTNTEGGLAYKILPISIELGGNLKKKAIQKIKVTFVREECS